MTTVLKDNVHLVALPVGAADFPCRNVRKKPAGIAVLKYSYSCTSAGLDVTFSDERLWKHVLLFFTARMSERFP